MSAAPRRGDGAAEAEQLVCPSCARVHAPQERFCADCGMPLVHAAREQHQPSARQRRARKIKPEYAEGELVKVARAQNETEARFLEGLLLEEGNVVFVVADDGWKYLSSGIYTLPVEEIENLDSTVWW